MLGASRTLEGQHLLGGTPLFQSILTVSFTRRRGRKKKEEEKGEGRGGGGRQRRRRKRKAEEEEEGRGGGEREEGNKERKTRKLRSALPQFPTPAKEICFKGGGCYSLNVCVSLKSIGQNPCLYGLKRRGLQLEIRS